MDHQEIRFYLDENLPPELAVQLNALYRADTPTAMRNRGSGECLFIGYSYTEHGKRITTQG
ncbi:MAG: hypothetical protein F4X87_12230 [Chloroflexi bacterium]|nr:hypothetical protein [Chloroflexota bacterium]